MTTRKNPYIDQDNLITREMSNIPGIYCIINIANGKKYIGSTRCLFSRMNSHFRALTTNKHKNPHLQKSFNKYGYSNFLIYLLKICPFEELFETEQFYLDTLKPEYNINPLATGRRFAKLSTETIEKIAKRRFKKICQYDTNGNLIATFPSLKEVYSSLGYKKSGALGHHLKGEIRTYKGYFWSYYGKVPIIREKHHRNNTKIICITEKGNQIEFSSIKEASKKTKSNRTSIFDCLTGKLKKGKLRNGLYFKYHEEV